MFNYSVPVSVNSASKHANVRTVPCADTFHQRKGSGQIYSRFQGTAAKLPGSRCRNPRVPRLLRLPEELRHGMWMLRSAEASSGAEQGSATYCGQACLALAPSVLRLQCKSRVTVAFQYLEPKLPQNIIYLVFSKQAK